MIRATNHAGYCVEVMTGAGWLPSTPVFVTRAAAVLSLETRFKRAGVEFRVAEFLIKKRPVGSRAST